MTVARNRLSIEEKAKKRKKSLSDIFENEGHFWKGRVVYTKNALLCQDIINYSGALKKPNAGFKFTELAKWLMTHNREFIDYYSDSDSHVSMSNRIQARRQRIQQCIDDLVGMTILERKGTVNAARNPNQKTPVYVFTNDNKFLNLLIRYSWHPNGKRKNDSDVKPLLNMMYSEIIDTLLKMDERVDRDLSFSELQEENSCLVKFSESIIRKMGELGLFPNFIEFLLHDLHFGFERSENLWGAFLKLSMLDNLADYTNPMFRMGGAAHSQTRWQLWKESYDRLDEGTRNLILHHIKSSFEFRFRGMPYYRRYELKRFQLRNDLTRVVLDPRCLSDSHIEEPHVMNTLDAIKARIDGKWSIEEKCKKCGKMLQIHVG